jgi:gluconate 2-dehydrogenase gamma chain
MAKKEKEKQKKLFADFLAGKINRRTFIIAVSAFAGGYGLSKILPEVIQLIQDSGSLTTGQEKILKDVQLHLFPSTETSPGADEINALFYLQLVLLDPALDPRDQNFIISGIGRLEEESRKMFSTGFTKLEFRQKEQILREIEKENWGERWLSNLLKYIFEALLTDPIYGGNPEGIGWEWLTHTPGIPRPSEENRYGGMA